MNTVEYTLSRLTEKDVWESAVGLYSFIRDLRTIKKNLEGFQSSLSITDLIVLDQKTEAYRNLPLPLLELNLCILMRKAKELHRINNPQMPIPETIGEMFEQLPFLVDETLYRKFFCGEEERKDPSGSNALFKWHWD